MLIKNIIDKSKLFKLDINDIVLIGQTSNSLRMKKILLDIFQENKKINEEILCNSFNKNNDNEYLVSIGCVFQALNKNNLLIQKYIFIDICPSSFGVESFDGTMAIIIQKGEKLPSKNKKLVKLNTTLHLADMIDLECI
jgi:molecular chaperone DnaK (HSP70)